MAVCLGNLPNQPAYPIGCPTLSYAQYILGYGLGQCRNVPQESHCSLPLEVRQCTTELPLPAAPCPLQCGSVLQEIHCPLPTAPCSAALSAVPRDFGE